MNELAENIKRLRKLDAERTAFRDKLDFLYLSSNGMERNGLMANARQLDTLWKSSPNEMFKTINALVELVAEMQKYIDDVSGQSHTKASALLTKLEEQPDVRAKAESASPTAPAPKTFTDEEGREWRLLDFGYGTASDLRLQLRLGAGQFDSQVIEVSRAVPLPPNDEGIEAGGWMPIADAPKDEINYGDVGIHPRRIWTWDKQWHHQPVLSYWDIDHWQVVGRLTATTDFKPTHFQLIQEPPQ